ncbi:hypothetical protein [Brevundimonas sp.]|uniref:hypothetical protein n=1 Tax=Brevundimonas sp. TaxID=1871086 RepID=UPI002D5619BD|nr:hypothetical protein [Brevundimonas sp.]HYC74164.1 hypothetical protein [Brevundimonas sp.]
MDRFEVARFSTLPEAELATELLRSHGVDARVTDREMANNAAHLQIAMGGVRITAPDFQIVQARDLIARARRGEFGGLDADESDEWMVDHTPGKVGELDEHEIQGVMGSAKRAGVVVVVIFFVVLPLAGCLLMALG